MIPAAASPAGWVPPAARTRAAAPEPASMDLARSRLVLGLVLFLFALLAIAGRLVHLALFDQPQATARAALPQRGQIVDRNGVVLAQGYKAVALAVFPQRIIGDRAALAPRIAAILGEPVEKVAASLTPNTSFRYLARRLTPDEAAKVIALGEPAIEVHREPDRVYPNSSLGAHVFGFIDRDGLGRAGVERSFEERLAAGQPVELSIDSRVQQTLESELAAAMAKHSALGAAGVVIDVKTGEVLALASLPAFNPNAPGGEVQDNAYINRSLMGVYELGSCFKALTIAMGLDTGVVRLNEMVDARFPLQMGRFRIHDDHPKARFLSVPEVFIYSSNIGTARLADAMGPSIQQTYLRRLGFLEKAQIEFDPAERGRPLYPRDWGRLATMTVGYGHGIAVTPVHLATAYSALVNGGVWHPASLLKGGAGGEGVQVFKPETSATMRRLLRLVVTDGTGRKAEAPGYRVGGKTGTAEKPEGGRYARKAVIATFAGAFPMDDPRYVVIATLDEPHGTKDTYGFITAGWVSAPVVSHVVTRIAPLLGVAPDLGNDVDLTGLLPADAKAEE